MKHGRGSRAATTPHFIYLTKSLPFHSCAKGWPGRAAGLDGTLLTSVRIFHVSLQKVQLNWDKFQSPCSGVALTDANGKCWNPQASPCDVWVPTASPRSCHGFPADRLLTTATKTHILMIGFLPGEKYSSSAEYSDFSYIVNLRDITTYRTKKNPWTSSRGAEPRQYNRHKIKLLILGSVCGAAVLQFALAVCISWAPWLLFLFSSQPPNPTPQTQRALHDETSTACLQKLLHFALHSNKFMTFVVFVISRYVRVIFQAFVCLVKINIFLYNIIKESEQDARQLNPLDIFITHAQSCWHGKHWVDFTYPEHWIPLCGITEPATPCCTCNTQPVCWEPKPSQQADLWNMDVPAPDSLDLPSTKVLLFCVTQRAALGQFRSIKIYPHLTHAIMP
ncbi:hypothetical protein EK904_001309 [Melospiza melodia maxima]|nr:hypothetical protein EK904_001309 [Melospiza melodia maxima]